MYVINPLDTGRPVHYYTSDKSICHFVILCLSSLFCRFYSIFDGNIVTKQCRLWVCSPRLWPVYRFPGKNGLKLYRFFSRFAFLLSSSFYVWVCCDQDRS